MYLSVNILAVLIYCLTVVVVYHSYKFRGAFKTLLLLVGVFIVGGGIENINITFRGYYYPEAAFNFYIYRCPLWVILGWYLILYCGVFMSHILIGKGRGSLSIIGIGTEPENGIDRQFIRDTILRSLLAAYISMLLGLIMDTVAAANGWWVWEVDNIYIHGVPFGNYIGWVLVIFWLLLFHDIIIVKTSIKEKKEITTAGYWAVGCIAALFLAGVILMGFTFWFGLEGIRTDDRTYLMDLILTVEWFGIIISFIIILITIGVLLVCSYAPNELPEPRPTEKIWFIIPPVCLLIYWVVMMVVTFLTSYLLFAVAIINSIPLIWINLYVIKNPFLDEK
ncbi:MAG: carotenoid biosynthesis protein [Promethearchaeota archaeon]